MQRITSNIPTFSSQARSSSGRRRSSPFLDTLHYIGLVLILLTTIRNHPSVDSTPLPQSTYDPNAPITVATTFFWFNNLEVGICYDPGERLKSVEGFISCNMQDYYDMNNNTFKLPQTCIALKPKDEPLLARMKLACKNANGKFDLMQPNSPESQAAATAAKAAEPEAGGGGMGSLLGLMRR